jgi:hypothetical protein
MKKMTLNKERTENSTYGNHTLHLDRGNIGKLEWEKPHMVDKKGPKARNLCEWARNKKKTIEAQKHRPGNI